MSDEFSARLLALYRESATDEPGARLDEAVLRAARRHEGRARALRAGMLIAACAALALAVNIGHAPQHPVAPVAASLRPGLEDGRALLFLLTLRSDTQRPGMARRPAMLND
jgi:hypothetical protein